MSLEFSPSVIRLAKAIKVAEGSPLEYNNPGDLTGVDRGSFPVLGTANTEGVWKFVNAEDGWNALCLKLARIFAGHSTIYPLTMTLAEMGLKYSSGDPNWSKNVATALHVPETITLQDLGKP